MNRRLYLAILLLSLVVTVILLGCPHVIYGDPNNTTTTITTNGNGSINDDADSVVPEELPQSAKSVSSPPKTGQLSPSAVEEYMKEHPELKQMPKNDGSVGLQPPPPLPPLKQVFNKYGDIVAGAVNGTANTTTTTTTTAGQVFSQPQEPGGVGNGSTNTSSSSSSSSSHLQENPEQQQQAFVSNASQQLYQQQYQQYLQQYQQYQEQLRQQHLPPAPPPQQPQYAYTYNTDPSAGSAAPAATAVVAADPMQAIASLNAQIQQLYQLIQSQHQQQPQQQPPQVQPQQQETHNLHPDSSSPQIAYPVGAPDAAAPPVAIIPTSVPSSGAAATPIVVHNKKLLHNKNIKHHHNHHQHHHQQQHQHHVVAVEHPVAITPGPDGIIDSEMELTPNQYLRLFSKKNSELPLGQHEKMVYKKMYAKNQQQLQHMLKVQKYLAQNMGQSSNQLAIVPSAKDMEAEDQSPAAPPPSPPLQSPQINPQLLAQMSQFIQPAAAAAPTSHSAGSGSPSLLIDKSRMRIVPMPYGNGQQQGLVGMDPQMLRNLETGAAQLDMSNAKIVPMPINSDGDGSNGDDTGGGGSGQLGGGGGGGDDDPTGTQPQQMQPSPYGPLIGGPPPDGGDQSPGATESESIEFRPEYPEVVPTTLASPSAKELIVTSPQQQPSISASKRKFRYNQVVKRRHNSAAAAAVSGSSSGGGGGGGSGGKPKFLMRARLTNLPKKGQLGDADSWWLKPVPDYCSDKIVEITDCPDSQLKYRAKRWSFDTTDEKCYLYEDECHSVKRNTFSTLKDCMFTCWRP
ncbi:mastermind-like domain-containing protein 1 [Oppia nitens]|uniref:mastermind-like domain-containing protein 1 n=1 Tax=Oppia nitens TaxID=1686743 RepID=UPI0023DAFEDA|nr:mastermind-like domain-containing protein 1 [Oppia nitens]